MKKIKFLKIFLSKAPAFVLAIAITIPAFSFNAFAYDLLTGSEYNAGIILDAEDMTIEAVEESSEESIDKAADADTEVASEPEKVYAYLVDENDEPVKIGVYTVTYENKLYISLRDLAAALIGTKKQFNFEYSPEEGFLITKGVPYVYPEDKEETEEDESEGAENAETDAEPVTEAVTEESTEIPSETEPETEPPTRPESVWLEDSVHILKVDGSTVKYYSFVIDNVEDVYVSMLNACQILDINMEFEEDTIFIDTESSFTPDIEALNEDHYFDYLRGVFVGDATTGETLFAVNENTPAQIASTTKLMTYTVLSLMAEKGDISFDDTVTISKKAADLSNSPNGVIYMYEGQQVSFKDLVAAMLIRSSNEAALALAEYAAGTESEFVARMNRLAKILDMPSAVFYNPHGLPEYSSEVLSAAHENTMSAEDMFKLVRYIFYAFPEITEYTSKRSLYLETLDTTVTNTNNLLYNMPDCIGLKTGTTDVALCCLVSAVPVQTNGKTHIIVSIVFGADYESDRFDVSELLLNWAKQQY